MMKWACILLVTLSCISCDSTDDRSVEVDTRPVDHVYPLLDAAHSRWFYFASACRPFGMVTLNPDTEHKGAWGSGYRYNTDTIRGFSHIHAWQLSGVSLLPVTYDEITPSIFEDYASPFRHEDEKVEVGYHKVVLDRYDVTAELTSTTRVGMHRYTFKNKDQRGVMFKLGGTLGPSVITNGKLEKIDDHTLQGQMTNLPTRRRPKDAVVYFNVIFDQPIQGLTKGDNDNVLVAFDSGISVLNMKVGLSYTSNANASINMQEELPEWHFDEVVQDSKSEWNDLLSRIKISDEDSIQVRRFYTDLWHGLQGRRIISDVNGAYPDNTGPSFRIGTLPLNENRKPLFNHYNSDSFWGAQWTLNTLWGLVYPDVYSEFVNSLLIYYKDGGMIPRGPSGGNYTYVMTGSSATPFLVSAYQKGIRDYDVDLMYEGLKKNHMPKGIMAKAGYEHETFLGGGLNYYIDRGYVPYPIPEGKFGYHQDGASLTLEYAYQDWTLAQLALALGKSEDYDYFMKRADNYKNVFDEEIGWMRPKDMDGQWKAPFDPYEYEHGFNESNGAQSTWFVGHDIPGLADLMGGPGVAVAKLNSQFEKAAQLNFTPGNSHERGEDPTRARIPINYGNQPSIQTAFIFNQLGRPDLTQYWSSEVAKRTFGGLSPETGYSGDEDQGLMGSLAVLIKLGIFQMNGGTEADPKYEFGSPLFSIAAIALPNGNQIKVIRKGTGVYIDNVAFNGNDLADLYLRHSELTGGGELVFSMRTTPK